MELGTVDYGRNIGKIKDQRYSWVQCPTCKKERWVAFYGVKPTIKACKLCNGRKQGKINKKKWGMY
jgi:hypothetical protein